MTRNANTAVNQSSAVESTMEFTFTEENLPVNGIFSRGEFKEPVV